MLGFKNIIKTVGVSVHNNEFRILLSLTFFILLMGTFVYHRVEHWRWLDSFYFSVTTLATVGFGDVAPKTDFGKLFTVFYIFVGIGVIFSFITTIGRTNQSLHPRNRK
jgi:hypothetical protein